MGLFFKLIFWIASGIDIAERLSILVNVSKISRSTFFYLHNIKISRSTMRQGGVMKIADAEAFGNELRTRRKELGYTQAYIAEFTGFSVSFISDLERGKETCEIGKAIEIVNLLGMDLCMEKRGK